MSKVLIPIFLALTLMLTGCSDNGSDMTGASGWVVMSIGDTGTPTNSGFHLSTVQAVLFGFIILILGYLAYKKFAKKKRGKK